MAAQCFLAEAIESRRPEKPTAIRRLLLVAADRSRRAPIVHCGVSSAWRSKLGVWNRCMARVRTNIEIEDDYLRAVMDRYGVHTKTEAVDLALRHLAGQPMSRDEALAMRGADAIIEIPEDATPTGG